MVRLARLCEYLPDGTAAKLEARSGLAKRVQDDWRSLALAVVKTELGRRSGEIDVIRQPVAYLVKVAAEIRVEDPGPSVHTKLATLLGQVVEAQGDDRQRRLDLARNPVAFRASLETRWTDLADMGADMWTIEDELKAEVRRESEALGLEPWEEANRRQVVREFLTAKRAPRLAVYDEDDEQQDDRRASRRHG